MINTDSSTRTSHLTDFSSYVISNDNQVTNRRNGGRFDQCSILTYTDTSEWVFLKDKQKERFCGFLYLQNALKEAGLSKLKAATNKMAIYNKEVIYLSQYCGETKPDIFKDREQIFSLIRGTGFRETTANLRKKDEEIYVFDTEKASFDLGVHEKIDSFVTLHDRIRSSLEESLTLQN